jgi:PAP2 superfamily
MKISKKILQPFFLLIGLSLTVISCDKTIVEPTKDAYRPIKLDVNAGTWKTYVLESANEFVVPEPKPFSSSEYQAELLALKDAGKNLSSENKKAIEYWGAGAVYRWHEIGRLMAARYNIAPEADANGFYPIPNILTPQSYPKFPFASPPYSSRACAYLAVVQYDALVAAWNYKYKYKRNAPYKYDTSIQTALPMTDLPSYPSEDAVVAAASFKALSTLYPCEIEFLTAKLEESKNVRLWAGMNVKSDIDAGEALGKAIGTKVVERALKDGALQSGSQANTPKLMEAAISRGIKNIWVSQEIPARPPMLPNFGLLPTWNFDRATLNKIRPVMPYIVGSPEWQKDYDELQAINKNQTREQARIANFWNDGNASYSPPGHWNKIAAELCHENKFSEVAMARTMALVGTALMDAGIGCWETKFYYFTARPQQFGLKTSIGTPNFPSYTSGHSTYSAASATVLSYIFPSKKDELEAMALEASNSRVYGLIHFRVDCEMGLEHGKKIGQYAVARGKADGSEL